MKVDLEPAKEVLRSFLAEIESVKEIRKGISDPVSATSFAIKDQMPEFTPTEDTFTFNSCWEQDKRGYAWSLLQLAYKMHRAVAHHRSINDGFVKYIHSLTSALEIENFPSLKFVLFFQKLFKS